MLSDPAIQIIFTPLVAIIITQTIKAVILLQKRQTSSIWQAFNAYGGMPSAHTAYVISLVATLLLFDGLTPATGVAVALAFIVIRDAVGLRQLLGEHSEAINHIMGTLHHTKRRTFPRLAERMGHTPLEALTGGLIGLFMSALGYWIAML